ncbi:hypothetical protein [Natronorarus salvus]|uniref:hypothetical protein n=1 Tax=Natronorarus salvus TaxID=3117733 RepID=UPI002F26C70C
MDDVSEELLARLGEEGSRALDGQLATLDAIDSKAHSILQVNVALATLVFTALAVPAGFDGDATAGFANAYTLAGFLALTLSAALAGLLYTATSRYGGLGPDALDRTIEDGLSGPEFDARLVASYAAWLRANRRTNARKAPLVTLSVLLLVIAIAGLGLGAVEALRTVTLPLLLSTALGLSALAAVSGLPRQLSRWRRVRAGASVADVPETALVAEYEPFGGLQTGVDAELE